MKHEKFPPSYIQDAKNFSVVKTLNSDEAVASPASPIPPPLKFCIVIDFLFLLGEEEVRNRCLQLWQKLTQEEKADYKTSRIPKRKHEEEQNVSTASKLARFAVSK